MSDDTKPKNRLLLVAAGLTAIVVIGVAAYILWPRKPEHILIVGDSVSYLSMPKIQDEFGDGTKVQPITIPGNTSTDLLPRTVEAIDERESSGGRLERAIFLVGYNDVIQGRLDSAELEPLVEQSARYECAVWLTLPGEPAGQEVFGDLFPFEDVEEWNQRTRDLVDQYENLHLVTDWEEAVNNASVGEYLEPDGIHPNENGQAKLAQIMVNTIMSSCRFS